MFGGHLREDSVEVGLVFFVDESVVEDSLCLVAEEPENLFMLANHSRICLEHPYKIQLHQLMVVGIGGLYSANDCNLSCLLLHCLYMITGSARFKLQPLCHHLCANENANMGLLLAGSIIIPFIYLFYDELLELRVLFDPRDVNLGY